MWLSVLSTGLRSKGWLVRFPVRAHAWVAGQVPSRGRARGNHTLMFLSLCPSLPLSLKISNKIFFLKKKQAVDGPSLEPLWTPLLPWSGTSGQSLTLPGPWSPQQKNQAAGELTPHGVDLP